MSPLATTLLTIAGVWFIAAATPGPDFLLVTRMAILHGRREALNCVAGISTSILVWGMAGFFGIHALFLAVPWLYAGLKIGGGAYLIYIGGRLLRESFRAAPGGALGSDLPVQKSPHGFKLGLMTNLSNPKVAIFSTSLFAATLPPKPSLALGMAAIALMVTVASVWFVFVVQALTTGPVAAMLRRGIPRPMSEPRTVRGFIIGRLPFGNTSLIVRTLTREAGRLTFMVKGAARPKSPFAGLLDLFYLADFLYAPSRTAEMHTLREVKLAEPHLGLRKSYANLIAAQYFAELIEAITEPGTPVPGEFELFAKAVAYLCDTPVSWRVVERFEQRILTLAGVAQPEHDLPRAFHSLHHKVPALRDDLRRQLAKEAPPAA
jgi:threonine/homoserine/homoserine lactone efflux protein